MSYSDAFKKLLATNLYKLVTGVPIFDAHAEYDDAGKLVRKFGKTELQEICDKTNKRAEETGTLALVAPGHTIPKAPETSQPEPWGYQDNLRVAKFGKEDKPAIFADWLIKNDKSDEAQSFPHRSIELWPKDKVIDWVAQLRRAPQRDLGILRWGKTGAVPATNIPMIYSHEGKSLNCVVREDQKLCYSLEHAMPLKYVENENKSRYEADPTEKPDAMTPGVDEDKRKDDEDYARYSKHCARYMKDTYPMMDKMHDEYKTAHPPEEEHAEDGSEPHEAAAAPSGSPLPGEEDKIHMSKIKAESEQIQYARFKAELDASKAEIAKLRAESDESKKKARYARAEQKYQSYVARGYKMNAEHDIEQFANLDEKGAERYGKLIETTRKQDDFGFPVAGMIQVEGNDEGQPARYSREVSERATEIALEKGISMKEALKLAK